MESKELYLDIHARHFDAYVAAQSNSKLTNLYVEDYPLTQPALVPGPSMKFLLYAKDYLRELGIAIQLFRADIHRLEAWDAVLPSIDEDTLLWIIESSVLPLVSFTVSLPYALRDRFVYCTVSLLHHSSHVLSGGFEETWTEKVRRQDLVSKTNQLRAKQLGIDIVHFDSVLKRMSIDGSPIDTIRHRIVHRLPPSIEYGSATTLARISLGKHVAYGFGGDPPLRIRDTLPLLIAEHRVSVEAFEAFHAQTLQMISGLEAAQGAGT
jgi:hypothetical protein